MTSIVIACIIYIFILAYLSYKGYKNTKSNEDYLLGGREVHPFVMAISYGSTFISTSAIIGFGGLAANLGLGLLWLTFLNVFIGVFIAFIFFGKRTHKLGLELDAHTFPELIGKRFNSKMVQVLAGAMIFLFMPIYAAAIIKGGVNFIEAYFKIPYDVALFGFVTIVAIYVLVGGFKAVMYTDTFQGAILFVAMLMLLFFAYMKLGGVVSAHTQLSDLYNNPAIQGEIGTLKAQGFVGWTSMPKFNSPLWWNLISSILGAVGFGVLAQPQLIVRFMTVKSTKDINRAVLSGGIFILIMAGGAYIVGALSNVITFNDLGMLSKKAADGVSDMIIPHFITTYMPSWYGVVFLVAMLAAAMSTLSAQFHTMGSSLGRDVGGVLMPKYKDSLSINRYGMLITILMSLLLAWLSKYLDAGDAIIARGTIIFFEMTICAFLPLYMGALFSKNMPKIAAEVGMVVGIAVWFFWTFFVSKIAGSLAICKLITGKSYLLEGTGFERLAAVGSSIFGITASILTIIVVWKISNIKKAKVS